MLSGDTLSLSDGGPFGGKAIGAVVVENIPLEKEEVMTKPCFLVASCRRERRTRQVKMECNTRSALKVRLGWRVYDVRVGRTRRANY
jgi:hypothetical protein